MIRLLAIVKRVLRDALGHFNNDDGWAMASHVAMSVLLAIFPFLIFATTLASFLGAGRYTDPAVELVFDSLPDALAEPLAFEIHAVLSVPQSGLLTISALLALFFSSNGVEALRTALNRAYRVEEKRSLVFRRIQSLFFVLVSAVGMMSVSVLLVLAPTGWKLALSWFPDLEAISATFDLARYLVVGTVMILSLYVTHLWLPAGKRLYSVLWPGIGFTLLFWIAGSLIFASYVENFSSYSATYAGLAGGVIALLFLYMLAAIFILGAEINTAMGRYRLARVSVSGSDDGEVLP